MTINEIISNNRLGIMFDMDMSVNTSKPVSQKTIGERIIDGEQTMADLRLLDEMCMMLIG